MGELDRFFSNSAIALMRGKRPRLLLLLFGAVFVWYFVHGTVG
jgi:hypothetical protein